MANPVTTCNPSSSDIRENERLRAVRAHAILDTEPELEFDSLARVAAHAFQAPIAVVAMMDAERLWFKSRIGLDIPQLDRKVAFCAHTIAGPGEPLVVNDLRVDGRFVDNPLVSDAPHLRFYAGAPIVDVEGHSLGTIAVIDACPRPFTDSQRETLIDLSHLVVTALHARRRAMDLRNFAMTDHLTGIGNRACFDMALERAARSPSGTDSPFAILTMDLDGFKQVNDTHGHEAGDEVLREVGRRLKALVRDGDALARLGGDEFGIVLSVSNREKAEVLARRVVESVRRAITLPEGVSVSVGISIGVADATDRSVGLDGVVAQADRELYRNKKGLRQTDRSACGSFGSQPR